jgi:tripartite-type tricarboxylate transporter receptor subunit TctC
MLNDLLGGQVQVGIATLAVFKPFMSEGRLRVIAVGERTRFSGTPEIPTIAETLPGFELTTWLGFFGPTGIPAAVAGTLTSALVNALRDDSLRTKLADSALLVRADGPEALERVVRADYELYGRVIREYKITTD